MIVEGEKAELALMERALKVYGIAEVEEIYSYKANIYDLWRLLFESSDDTEDINLM